MNARRSRRASLLDPLAHAGEARQPVNMGTPGKSVSAAAIASFSNLNRYSGVQSNVECLMGCKCGVIQELTDTMEQHYTIQSRRDRPVRSRKQPFCVPANGEK